MSVASKDDHSTGNTIASLVVAGQFGKRLETHFPSLDWVGRAVSTHLPMQINAGSSRVNSMSDQKAQW